MSKDNTNSSPISFKDITLKIEDFKGRRDELNKKTKEYINNLQEIDSKIIKLLKTAKDVFKRKRDSWNKKVKELKVKKVEYKTLLDNLIEEKKKIPKTKKTGPKKFISVDQIDRKIENLERIIETENLDMSEENDIVDKIRALAEQKQEQVIAQENDNFYKIERKIEIVKINLNKIYESLNKWSNKSQENHKIMLEMYQEANELKDKKKIMEEGKRVLKPGGDFLLWDLTIPERSIEEKDIILVILNVKFKDKILDTGYGVKWDKIQDANHFMDLGKVVGFEVLEQQEEKNIFYIKFRKG